MPEYKNKLKAPAHIEQTVVTQRDAAVGTLRFKPSGVLWKPSGAHRFYRVSLKKFSDWITDPATKAGRVKQ